MRRAVDPKSGRSTGRVAALAVGAFVAGIAFRVVTAPGGAERHDEPAPLAIVDPTGRLVAAPVPGPTRTEHGVPAGFGPTPEGALAAATAFVCSGQALLDMDPLAVEKAVRQMASTATADAQAATALADLRRLRDRLFSGTGPVMFRQAVVAWRLESFGEDRARVSVWHVGVLAREGIAAPQASWAVSTLELVWERDDWHLDRESVVPGPAPVLDNSAAPATAAQFRAALDGFLDFGGAR